MDTVKHHARRVAIGIAGGATLVIGIIAIPYPGPGWVIVFAGLAILATEFAWAQRALDYAKSRYDAWTNWIKHQKWPIRLLVLALTGLVVVVTLWLLNTLGLVAGWLHLPYHWLNSPFF